MSYYFSKKLNESFDNCKDKVIEQLKNEGFGILTEIDVQKTLKTKLDVDFYRYEILGSCNPKLAYEALKAENKIGVMLPCNVILQQANESEAVEISAVDPVASMAAINNPDLKAMAEKVQSKLKKVIESL